MAEETKEKVLVLVGPTASGKTALSIALAEALNGEIISADSMQVYKHMNIGTAKIKKEEMKGIPHHLIDMISPNEEFSVADFKEMALFQIEDILSRGKLPMVVGGTGLYINGLTLPWSFEEKNTDEKIRWCLEAEGEAMGKDYLFDQLKTVDPKTAEQIHPNNVKRVIRALEIFEVTGKTKSYFDEKGQKETIPYDYQLFGLKWDRERLYDRINQRVEMMINEGLLNEIESLLDRGYHWDLAAMKAIGYKEFRACLEKKIPFEEAERILKRDSRHFAKRQMTWFRKDERIHWIEMNQEKTIEECKKEMIKIFKSR
ncbi:MAG: tRNA (adenosine(37)-N6)-dimethylallyltransferase MiaA [Eubacteriaceae bacterium]